MDKTCREKNSSLEGSGCDAPRSQGCQPASLPCEVLEDSGPLVTDTASFEVHLEGSGSGCVQTPSIAPSMVLVLLVVGIRRWAAGAIVIFIGVLGADAWAVDVEALQFLDGGPVPGLVEPTLGPAWTPRLAMGGNASLDPIRLRTSDGSQVLVESLLTAESTLSIQLADWFVAGFSLPVHHASVVDGPAGSGIGDRVYFLRLPVSAGDKGGSALDVRMQAPVPRIERKRASSRSNPAAPWTQAPSVSLGWLAARHLPGWWVGGRLGARLQQDEALKGLVWTSRWEANLGARRDFGRFGLGASLLGSAPLAVFVPPTASWPIEGLGFAAVAPSDGVELQLGGGAGLTRGLGTPSMRMFLSLTRVWGDRDQDGYPDPRDLCARLPEDRDQFRDGDGCPDPDNDRDGFVDQEDRCPNDAEVWNGWKDDDGCPDHLVAWRIEVRSSVPLEAFQVVVNDREVSTLEPSMTLDVVPGFHRLAVHAPGHDPSFVEVDLQGTQHETLVDLVPVQMGVALVRLVSAVDGTPLEGVIRQGEAPQEISREGTEVPLRIGARTVEARSPGFEPEVARILVARDRVAEVEIRLEPRAPLAEPPKVVFELGSDQLVGAGVDLMDGLAKWLLDRPDIVLIRVEGHADEVGGSAYNLALSRRRADQVVAALVARGVASGRLQAIGSGEGRSWLALADDAPVIGAEVSGMALREVSFRVLVWDDAARPRTVFNED